MEAIGGYFSLELPLREEYHKDAIRLNTGRNCLEYILRVRQYKKVYVPYYTCEAVMEPINKLGVQYEYYHIDTHFEIRDRFTLKEGEALLYTNYYGLKQRYVEQLAEKMGSCLIIDNTQAFYAKPVAGIDTFYTCRKFFGVPDGAYLYCDKEFDEDIEQDYSYDRMAHLMKRIDLSAEEGYKDFRKADDGLDNQPILRMSKLTERLMQSIDYDDVAKKRRANFMQLHNALCDSNRLNLPLDNDSVPMVYPYMVSQEGLREKLIENKIFVARYWPNVLDWTEKGSIEYQLTEQMQPLPIDQRYGIVEMNHIINNIKL
jgi:hypothetical protein